ncbi:MAG TPA: transglutaminase-like domain-containing protein [Candidatus Nanoarchaeia archaeon]|nr:transglutaminase-like domain-containing protein [Candidatus Nanoarchaeia archaeon]
MKRLCLIAAAILLANLCSAEDWAFRDEHADISIKISGKIDVIPKGSDSTIDHLTANLSLFPQDGLQQEVLTLATEPRAEIQGDNAVFRWEKPPGTVKYILTSNVRTNNNRIMVKEEVPFPLDDIPDSVYEYTKPSQTIDSDDRDVIRQASVIAQGDNDLYSIEFKLGRWIKENIQYNLSTLTESVSQDASWVLQNRQGVCDEITNLFIAMNRALGIPAKFISGVAWTNALESGEGFGPHGWAEVYLPGYGWTPYDITYGEYGFVDISHVKLKEGVDVDKASTQFQWLSHNMDVRTSVLDIKAEVQGSDGTALSDIAIEATALKNDVAFGSYNIIEGRIKNLQDYYNPVELSLSKPNELILAGRRSQAVLLKPNEERSVYWTIAIAGDLEEGYYWTFPVMITSSMNDSAIVMFNSSVNGKFFSKEELEEAISEGEEDKQYAGGIELYCTALDDEIYIYEKTVVNCSAKNTGNIYLEGLNICQDDECRRIDIGITQQETIAFAFEPTIAGMQEISIKATGQDVSKSAFVDITVFDIPELRIDEISYPKEVSYNDMLDISFVLSKKSKYPPQNITIKLNKRQWMVNQLSEDRKFSVKIAGKDLSAGDNKMVVSVGYKDGNGKEYNASEELTINLANVSLFQRIILFFRHLI